MKRWKRKKNTHIRNAVILYEKLFYFIFDIRTNPVIAESCSHHGHMRNDIRLVS